MKKSKKLSKNGNLAVAILWTITTAFWAVTTVLRITLVDYSGEGLVVMTAIAFLACLVAATANWYRYIHYEEE